MAKRSKAAPEFSAGARYERKTMRAYLKRQLAKATTSDRDIYNEVLTWVQKRRERYGDVEGGLGKKLPRQVKK